MSRMKRRNILGAGLGLAAMASARGAAAATPEIVIGAVYPLSGNAAAIGRDAQMALETEAKIINGHHDVPMLLGQGGGLPGLGGAKIRLVFADSQNNPQMLGATVLIPVQQLFVAWLGGAGAGVDLMIYGALIVLLALARPQGLVSLVGVRSAAGGEAIEHA